MKKRISILLVLVMVLSMIPMAAFANYSAAASTVVTPVTTVATGVYADINVYLRDPSTGSPVTGPVTNKVYVTSSRDAETIQMKDNLGAWVPVVEGAAGNSVYALSPDGVVNFRVKSNIAGEATLTFYKDAPGASSPIIGKSTVTFTAQQAVANQVILTATKMEGGVAAVNQTVYSGDVVALTARVVDGTYNPIANREVVFSGKRTSAATWRTVGTATTDSLGKATILLTENEAASYDYTATSVVTSTPVNVVVNALNPMKIEFVTTTEIFQTNLGTTPATFDLALIDAFGNKQTGIKPVITIMKKPANSSAVYTEASGLGITNGWVNATKNYRITINNNLSGEYTVRAHIPNTGIFAEKTFVSQPKSETVKVELVVSTGARSVINKGVSATESTTLTLREADKDNVKVTPSNLNNYVFSSSDVSLATVSESGGTITVTNAAYASTRSGEVTITAVNRLTGLSATAKVYVTGNPVSIKATPVITAKEATVTLQLVDANGNNAVSATALATDTSDPAYDVYEGTLQLVSANGFFGTNGTATLKFRADEYGKYPVTVVTKSGIATTFELDFTVPASEKPVFGAKNVILTIGGSNAVVDNAVEALDVAPFIQEGRTFVPVRFIAEAFGAEVSFTTNAQGLTETVTLTREDKVVMMTIGTSVITVVENGQTTLVPSDVAPTVVSGRTVLPFRALAEAMGAEVNFGMKADNSGVAWVSFAQ